MRRTTILALCSALAFAPAAYAQSQPAQPPAAGEAQAPGAAPAIKTVSIVALEDLPAAAQKQVTDATAQATEADYATLRTSLDASPQATAALRAKGLTSEAVIAAGLSSDGTLTLVTKKI
jgi:hypothetical protein